MYAKYMTTVLVGSALMATAAFAQSPSANSDQTSPPPAASSSQSATPSASSSPSSSKTVASSDTSYQGQWRASKLVGLKVYNDKNESVGSITELLSDKDGKINAVVIGVGGILGVGEHDVAVAFDKIKWSSEPVAYTGAGGTATNSGGAGSSTNKPPASTVGSASTAPAAAKPNPWYPDHAIYNVTKDELKAMPEITFSAN